ncbi:MAG TPA: TetR/AcrR family transcriptional regulator, partial [Rhodobacteraceae bacterium]|nr:TetR/AcrR family transcriptional regulator [Paracoccaceae bacterium]
MLAVTAIPPYWTTWSKSYLATTEAPVNAMSDHRSLKLPADKRAHLFRVASNEFAAHGFARASLNRIIGEVGMSKSSFYHYFDNKSDLFRQTFSDAVAPIMKLPQTIDIDALTSETLWPTVTSAMAQGMQIAQDRPEIITAGRMFYKSREDPEGAALTGEYLGAISAWTLQLIRRGQAVGVFRDDLPDDLIIDMLMAMGMTMDRWILLQWESFDVARRMQLG